MAPSTADTVHAFIAAINSRDVDRIVGLCSDDQRFVDAHGATVPTEALASAWAGYFGFMPHYQTILCEGRVATIFGTAGGGLNRDDQQDRTWHRPCAWRAEVRDGRIHPWQVHVDTKAVFDLLRAVAEQRAGRLV